MNCNGTPCGDLTGDQAVDEADYLVALANFGLGPLEADLTDCADARVSGDSYLDMADMLAWDLFQADETLSCDFTGLTTNRGTPATAGDPVFLSDGTDLVIAGKPADPNAYLLLQDYLYALDQSQVCVGPAMEPASDPYTAEGHRANGRLARDSAGNLYQIHANQGVIRLNTADVVVQPSMRTLLSGDTAYIGINRQAEALSFLGIPLSDVAFNPYDPDVLYVVPIVVEPGDFDTDPDAVRYRAGARLRLTGGGDYDVEAIYGVDPRIRDDLGQLGGWPPAAAPTKLEWLREVEVDAHGNVFLLSSHALGQPAGCADPDNCKNDWVLIYYDDGSGEPVETRVNISDHVASPTAMLISRYDPETLYVASSVDDMGDAQTRIWKYAIVRTGEQVTGLAWTQTITLLPPDDGEFDPAYYSKAHITSLAENPHDGSVYALGFAMPRFGIDPYGPLFTIPTLTAIPFDSSGPVIATQVDCHDLAFPISLVFAACHGDLNGDRNVDLVDLAAFLGTYGKCFGDAGYNLEANLVENDPPDGCITLDDLAEFLGHYGDSCQ